MIATTRSSVYYRTRKDPLTALRQRMRELAQTRVRFGYRRLRVLLLREGWEVGKERFYRNGTEFVSAAMDLWAYTNKVILTSVSSLLTLRSPDRSR